MSVEAPAPPQQGAGPPIAPARDSGEPLLRLALLPGVVLLLTYAGTAWRLGSAGLLLAGVLPLLFLATLAALYLRGYSHARVVIAVCRREEEALPRSSSGLTLLADAERKHDQAADAPRDTPEAAAARAVGGLPVPRLQSAVVECVRALRRGAAITQPATAPPLSDRSLSVLADASLLLGLAGGLLVGALPFASGSLPRDAVGASVAVALLVGLAGVLTHTGIRLCAVAQERQTAATGARVAATLADQLVALLPPALTSPEERLARILSTRVTEQSSAVYDLLANRLAQPVRELEQHASELALHSASWGEVAADLQAAFESYVGAQQAAQARQEAALQALFSRHEQALADAAAGAHQAYQEAQEKQSQALAAQFAELQRQQAEEGGRALEAALGQFSAAVAERVAGIEEKVSGALDALREQLPEAIRQSVAASLTDVVSLADLVREQAGGLCQVVDQIGQNAARQLEAYQRWAIRSEAWQTQLEAGLGEGQRAQEQMLAAWNERADKSLTRTHEALAKAAQLAESSQDKLATAERLLAERIASLDEGMRKLLSQLGALGTPIARLDDALVATGRPLGEAAGAVTKLNDAAVLLARAFVAISSGELKHLQSLKEAADALGGLKTALDRFTAAADKLGAAK